MFLGYFPHEYREWLVGVDYVCRIVVNFKPYTKDQILDIIYYRAEEASKPGAVTDEVLEYIANITVDYAKSNIRFTLDILLYSGTLAENQGMDKVSLEHLRNVLSQSEPTITSEDILTPSKTEKIVPLSVTQALKTSNTAYIDLEDIWEETRETYRYHRARALSRRNFNETL